MELRSDILIMRFDAQLYFANVDHFRNTLNEYIDKRNNALNLINLNFDSINSIISSAIHTLHEMIRKAKDSKIKLCFSGVKSPVRDKMTRSSIAGIVGEDGFFLTVQEAVDAYDQSFTRAEQDARSKFTMQLNT